ncbi:hypothetical protein [Oceanibaculum indicum]|uniref:Uncharacterized protein n=1 Tax=Oceanibaculum indicum TaxID=526216 RepID=A0A420WQ71_9PROT|nr:hypothetical protein [Oceanibaculum indicum]RKQ73183.1 hypothetical protein BCL74_0962 [Oceanibaculum indicum]
MSISGIGGPSGITIGSPSSISPGSSRLEKPTAQDEFLDYMTKSPAERMREMILGELDVTEEQLRNMDSQERAKIEEKIRETILEKVKESAEKKTGMIVDVAV